MITSTAFNYSPSPSSSTVNFPGLCQYLTYCKLSEGLYLAVSIILLHPEDSSRASPPIDFLHVPDHAVILKWMDPSTVSSQHHPNSNATIISEPRQDHHHATHLHQLSPTLNGAATVKGASNLRTAAPPLGPVTPPPSSPHSDLSNSAILSPVYWQHSNNENDDRTTSLTSRHPRGITLEDHTITPSETSGSLWAKAITVDSYVVVKGNPTGIGAYVVWNCKVETLDGGPIFMRKRYSEFDELRGNLIAAFPKAKRALPSLPPKSFMHRFQPAFLERRQSGLAYFLNCVMLNPEFAGSPILKEFIFDEA